MLRRCTSYDIGDGIAKTEAAVSRRGRSDGQVRARRAVMIAVPNSRVWPRRAPMLGAHRRLALETSGDAGAGVGVNIPPASALTPRSARSVRCCRPALEQGHREPAGDRSRDREKPRTQPARKARRPSSRSSSRATAGLVSGAALNAGTLDTAPDHLSR